MRPPSNGDKAHWRALLLERRKAHVRNLPAEALRAQARTLAAIIAPHLPAAGVVASYHPMGSEIDTGSVVAAARAAGCRIALPCLGDAAQPLLFRLHNPGEPLVATAGSAAQPDISAPLVRPDVVLVPLLGADRSGVRLGRGGGHYDRTLAALRASGPLFAIGLAHACQIVDRLPADQHDETLDALATPGMWCDFRLVGRP